MEMNKGQMVRVTELGHTFYKVGEIVNYTGESYLTEEVSYFKFINATGKEQWLVEEEFEVINEITNEITNEEIMLFNYKDLNSKEILFSIEHDVYVSEAAEELHRQLLKFHRDDLIDKYLEEKNYEMCRKIVDATRFLDNKQKYTLNT